MNRKILFGLFLLAVFLLLGVAVMYLWNGLLPSIIKVSDINYLQALGLMLLCRILFGGMPFGGKRFEKGDGKTRLKEKLVGMDEETRNAFKDEWKRRRNC